MKVIKFFIREDPYGFLSNFERTPIVIDGLTYPTVEHYYQSMKVDQKFPALRKWIREAPKASYVKAIGDSLNTHFIMKPYKDPDWEPEKKKIEMKKAITVKFSVYPNRQLLLDTGTAILHEDNTDDPFWGMGDGSGESWLGKLLMQVRDEIRKDEGDKDG